MHARRGLRININDMWVKSENIAIRFKILNACGALN